VELIPKTVVEVGYVGVVVSYTGETGDDLSGVDYKHGRAGQEGPAGRVERAAAAGQVRVQHLRRAIILVPTTNFILLKWISAQVGSHRFDENLAEVSLITKDAFEPSLPLSVVVHIDYRKRRWWCNGSGTSVGWSSRRWTRWCRRTSRTSGRHGR